MKKVLVLVVVTMCAFFLGSCTTDSKLKKKLKSVLETDYGLKRGEYKIKSFDLSKEITLQEEVNNRAEYANSTSEMYKDFAKKYGEQLHDVFLDIKYDLINAKVGLKMMDEYGAEFTRYSAKELLWLYLESYLLTLNDSLLENDKANYVGKPTKFVYTTEIEIKNKTFTFETTYNADTQDVVQITNDDLGNKTFGNYYSIPMYYEKLNAIDSLITNLNNMSDKTINKDFDYKSIKGII